MTGPVDLLGRIESFFFLLEDKESNPSLVAAYCLVVQPYTGCARGSRAELTKTAEVKVGLLPQRIAAGIQCHQWSKGID